MTASRQVQASSSSHGPGAAPPPSGIGSRRRQLLTLSLAALGVVFGDIGTSPLYAMRECFHGPHGIATSPANILGVLSLIFWALIIVISLKYLVFILRADNRGEGGILALSVLASHVKPSHLLTVIGLFGASLLYSDGMITPAITVLSAVEGLKIAAPSLEHFVEPIAIFILLGIFLAQSHGTARIGALFGPITLVWFGVIAILGVAQVAQNPTVLRALSPHYAVQFFILNGWHGYVILGAVFLVVTGGEALYADIGHFGVRPIRLVWFSLVLPALVLNYLGQGALLLQNPAAITNPFFELAPTWARYPLVLLAAAAAVIASQALITGAFSLTMQAVQLGYIPRVAIRHTSASTMGQIYVPLVNWLLMVSCVALVLGFKSSSNLAAAYGVSITSTMLITTVLFYVIARWRWRWNAWVVGLLAGAFLSIDLAFFFANFAKIFHGGWLPLLVASRSVSHHDHMAARAGCSSQRSWAQRCCRWICCWRRSAATLRSVSLGLPSSSQGNPVGTPAALLHNLKHNKVLHERVVILNVRSEETPHVPPADRLSIEPIDLGFWRMTLRFGFMDDPNVPRALADLCQEKFQFDLQRVSFFLGRERILATHQKGMARWREILFAWMSQNARDATSFFTLPPNRVVELGAQVEI